MVKGTENGRTVVLLALVVALCCTAGWAAPQVVNGSFEADVYAKTPGLRAQNGNIITGWTGTGNCGINPVWTGPAKRAGPSSPFHDNGAIPHGRQVALIQGPGSLAQRVEGFQQGRRYAVVYRENGRVQRQGNAWPKVRVRLGGQVVVSPHDVPPVGRKDEFGIPFARVVSAVFVAPEDGACELVIETIQELGTTTVFVDDVKIVELGQGQDAP